nr:metallophosphoesterase [uncultured Caproiciproducens sp.]
MRILVVSDTHRNQYALRQAILKQPSAEVVIHLGDGADEAQEMKDSFPDKMFLMVRGNCDWGSTLPNDGDINLCGKHIFYTHGYTYNVKYGLYTVAAAAHDRKADVLLFGHTHNALTDYENGLYIMNPGSLNGGRGTYGILDLTSAGIVTNILKI